MKPAPIVLFVYNRPDLLRRTLRSLSACTLAAESELFIFADGPKTEADMIIVNKVRDIIWSIKGYKRVTIFFSNHMGLAFSIISGVTKIVSEYGRVIVLEDDLILSPNFLVYMNACLESFNRRKDIASISGYSLPITIPKDYPHNVYLSCRPGSWGWATWRDRWENIDWNDKSKPDKAFNRGGDDLPRMIKQQRAGKVDSWAVRWAYHNYRYSLYTVYPCVSKVFNTGTGGGTHFRGGVNRFDVVIDQSGKFELKRVDVYPSEVITERFRKFWKYTLWKRFKLFILDLYDFFICPILR